MGTLLVVTLISLGLLTIGKRRRDGWPGFGPPTAKPYVSSGWGASRDYRATASNPHPKHYGLDFRAAVGTQIGAVAAGVVSALKKDFTSHAGWWVRVKHSNGLFSEYLHLSDILVTVGQKLVQGELLGLSGRSGTSADEHVPHLHLTIRADASALKEYVARFGTPASGFTDKNSAGYAVPGEPIVPSVYTSSVIENAKKAGVASPLAMS